MYFILGLKNKIHVLLWSGDSSEKIRKSKCIHFENKLYLDV